MKKFPFAFVTIVSIVALAVFVYVGVMSWQVSKKSFVGGEPVGEVTEDTSPQSPADGVATPQAQAIFDRYVSLGYPTADALPDDFRAEILDAVAAGAFTMVDWLTPDAGFEAALYGVTNYMQCGGYGQQLCFLVITNDKGTFVSYIVDSMRGSSYGSLANITLQGFSGGDKYIVTRATGDGPWYQEAGYEIDIVHGTFEEIASIKIEDNTPFIIGYGPAMMRIDIAEPEQAVYEGQPAEKRQVTFTASFGHNSNLETSEKPSQTATFTRLYPTNNSLWYDEKIQQPVSVDYGRTASYGTHSVDGVELYEPFSMGKGLYVWVYGALYYYDPAEGTFALNLDHSP